MLNMSSVSSSDEPVDDLRRPATRGGGGDEASPEHPAIGRYHDHILSLYRSGTASLAKMLVALAAGGLAISLTFVEKFAGPTPSYTWMLLIGWALLIATLLATLWSVYSSTESMLDAQRGYPWGVSEGKDQGGGNARSVEVLNKVAVLALTGGLMMLVVFAFINL